MKLICANNRITQKFCYDRKLESKRYMVSLHRTRLKTALATSQVGYVVLGEVKIGLASVAEKNLPDHYK